MLETTEKGYVMVPRQLIHDILQGDDALTGREFVPDLACLAGIYLVLAGNLVVLFPESFEAFVGRCAGCRFFFGRTGYPDN